MVELESLNNFQKGQRLLNAPVTEADLDEAMQCFIQAYNDDPTFYRALGWQGYTLVRKFDEGYAGASVLGEALRLAGEACAGDRNDYDNVWAVAIAQLYTQNWTESLLSYERAISLDTGGGGIHLHADFSVALIYFGDNLRAAREARLAKGNKDWHKWNVAWAYFFLGRREFQSSGDSLYLDLALEEIGSMVHKPHHKRYLYDAQLLAGAIHAIRGDGVAATEAMEIYWNGKPGEWTIEDEMSSAPFDIGNPEAEASRKFWESAAGQALAIVGG